jgi:hypothetical protein
MLALAQLAVVAVTVAGGLSAAPAAPSRPALDLEALNRRGITIVVTGGNVDTESLLGEARKFCAADETPRLVDKTARGDRYEIRFVCDKVG